jgi:hypothetical protein
MPREPSEMPCLARANGPGNAVPCRATQMLPDLKLG